jgi:hypothetical protein
MVYFDLFCGSRRLITQPLGWLDLCVESITNLLKCLYVRLQSGAFPADLIQLRIFKWARREIIPVPFAALTIDEIADDTNNITSGWLRRRVDGALERVNADCCYYCESENPQHENKGLTRIRSNYCAFKGAIILV